MSMGYLQNGFLAVYLALPPNSGAADHVTNGLDFPPWTAMPASTCVTRPWGPFASLSSGTRGQERKPRGANAQAKVAETLLQPVATVASRKATRAYANARVCVVNEDLGNMRCTEKAAPGTSCSSTPVYCESPWVMKGIPRPSAADRTGPFVSTSRRELVVQNSRGRAGDGIWLGLGWGLQEVRSWCLGLDAQKQFARRTLVA